jgi:hypothetical protein
LNKEVISQRIVPIAAQPFVSIKVTCIAAVPALELVIPAGSFAFRFGTYGQQALNFMRRLYQRAWRLAPISNASWLKSWVGF